MRASRHLRTIGVPIFFLAVAFQVTPALGIDPFCEILFEDIEGAGSPADLARAQRIFDAVTKVIEEGTGVELPYGGRAVDIPREHADGLADAFRKVYEGAADQHVMANALRARAKKAEEAGDTEMARLLNEDADKRVEGLAPFPIAVGNRGHMADHDAEWKTGGDAVARLTGIDGASYQLALRAHDIGKATVHGLLKALTDAKIRAAKEGGKFGPKEINEFVQKWVIDHEHQGIVQIPGVVKKYMKQQGMEPDGKDRHIYVYWSAQIMEMVRYHNGTRVVTELKKAYPSLSEEELAAVAKAWWANEYRVYSRIMGIKNSEYGSGKAPGPIGDTLNYFDRVTLTVGAQSPDKLLRQGAGSADKLDANWLRGALVFPPKGNAALMKADADRIRAHGRARGASAEDLDAFEAVHKDHLARNEQLRLLGEKLVTQQTDALLVRAFANDPKSNRVYIYYHAKTRDDGQEGPWYRIDVTNKIDAKIEKLDDDGRPQAYSLDDGTPVDATGALMGLLRKDKVWR